MPLHHLIRGWLFPFLLGSIAVEIGSPKVAMSGADQATVTFRQAYRSDVLKTTSTKTLVMVKNNGRWQIQQERSGS